MPSRTRLPIANCVEITSIFANPDSFVETTTHYRLAAPLTPADALTIASSWVDAQFSNWRPLISDTYSLTAVRVADMEVPTRISLDYGSFTPIQGLVTDPPLPAQVTASIRWKTGLAGKSRRGRLHMVGLVDSYVTGNILTSDYITSLNSLAATISGFAPGGIITNHVVASPTLGIQTNIVAHVIVPQTTTQRTRAKGVGR